MTLRNNYFGPLVPSSAGGSAVRNRTSIADIMTGIGGALACAPPGWREVFNLTGDEPVELRRVVRIVARVFARGLR